MIELDRLDEIRVPGRLGAVVHAAVGVLEIQPEAKCPVRFIEDIRNGVAFFGDVQLPVVEFRGAIS